MAGIEGLRAYFSPESHLNGQNLYAVVCSQNIRLIPISTLISNAHDSGNILYHDFLLPVSVIVFKVDKVGGEASEEVGGHYGRLQHIPISRVDEFLFIIDHESYESHAALSVLVKEEIWMRAEKMEWQDNSFCLHILTNICVPLLPNFFLTDLILHILSHIFHP